MTGVVSHLTPVAFPADTRTARANGRGGGRHDMLNWQQANQIANVAAARSHGALQVDLGAPRVDVVSAISRARLDLFWRPMPHLFGLYVNEPGAKVGILVNNGLPRGARRHTAAHELGHHTLDHATTVDDGSTIDVGHGAVDLLPKAGKQRRWPDQEMCAEAFAAWFLMPRRVVLAALRLLGLERPESALDVYRLSVVLGTSYATTLRHLPNLRLATARDSGIWSRVPPGRLKARLDRGVEPPADRRRDVVVVSETTSHIPLEVEAGDRLVLPGVSLRDVEAPGWLAIAGTTEGAELGDGVALDVLDLAEPRTGLLSVAAGGGWSASVEAGPQPAGRQPKGSPS